MAWHYHKTKDWIVSVVENNQALGLVGNGAVYLFFNSDFQIQAL